MIIKIALYLLLLSFALFVSDDILLELGIPKAPELVTRLGLFSLLTAFLMLCISGLVFIMSHIWQSLLKYFSAHERIHRRLLFIEAKQLQLKQLFFFKTKQIEYFHEQHKTRLMAEDNNRQIKALLLLIDRDLQHLKKHLPKADYLALTQARKQLSSDQNINGLLELQKIIANHATHNESS